MVEDCERKVSYVMEHPDICVTLNVYTHLGLHQFAPSFAPFAGLDMRIYGKI